MKSGFLVNDEQVKRPLAPDRQGEADRHGQPKRFVFPLQIVFRQAVQNGIQRNVRRRLLHCGTVLILTFCIWGHVSELFDYWDNTFKTGNDIEYSTVIVVLIMGAVLCFAHLAVVVAQSRKRTAHTLPPFALWPDAISTTVSSIAHSPPVLLRI